MHINNLLKHTHTHTKTDLKEKNDCLSQETIDKSQKETVSNSTQWETKIGSSGAQEALEDTKMDQPRNSEDRREETIIQDIMHRGRGERE